MKTCSFFKLLLLSLATFVLSFSSCNRKNEKQKPNVLLIIADDLGYKDLTCYGSSFYETPNLDRLASDGTMFTNAYASCPVCSPTRASIQTGKYPTTVNITDWIPGRAFYTAPSENDRLLSAALENQLAKEETTIGDALQKNGYVTFFAGKWHLGETEQFWPEHQGYVVNKGGWSKGAPNRSREKGFKGYFSPYGNPRLPDLDSNEYLPDRLADETIKFIEKNKDYSFYACLSFYLVHTPLQAKEEMIKKYKEKKENSGMDGEGELLQDQEWMNCLSNKSSKYKERVVQGHPKYASMIESLDENVGRVINRLKELGLYDNTIIIFTSDNGGLSTAEGSPTSNLPLRGGKGWLYEGGIRVAMIVKSHTKDKLIEKNVMPVSSIDIFPSILSMTGVEAEEVNGIEGVDFTNYLVRDDFPERPLFWHYPHYSNQGGNPGSAVILGDYKLIDDFETKIPELYNLKEDIGEKNNLADEMPEKVEELSKLLDEWRNKTSAKMMKPNPDWNGCDTLKLIK